MASLADRSCCSQRCGGSAVSLSSIVAAAGPTITFACARSLLLAFTLNVAALLAAAEDAEATSTRLVTLRLTRYGSCRSRSMCCCLFATLARRPAVRFTLCLLARRRRTTGCAGYSNSRELPLALPGRCAGGGGGGGDCGINGRTAARAAAGGGREARLQDSSV